MFVKKMQHVKLKLKKWNTEVFGNLGQKKNLILREVK